MSLDAGEWELSIVPFRALIELTYINVFETRMLPFRGDLFYFFCSIFLSHDSALHEASYAC